MHLGMDISNALQQLETIKAAVDQSEDPKLQSATNDDLNFLINLLESPVLRSIATLNDSMAMLATQVAHHPSILPADFEITLSGELELQSRNLYGGLETEEEQRVPQISPSHSIGYPVLASPQASDRILGLEGSAIDANMSHQQAITMLQQARGLVELVVARSATEEPIGMGIATPTIVNSEWAQVEVINLVNDGTGLGFGIIGARTSGVIVKTILAGGVADRDGRLRSGDHILQIGDAHLLDMVSEQVAGVLRASGTRVRLVVARPTDPSNPVVVDLGRKEHPMPPVVPARLLTEPIALDRYLIDSGSEPVFNIQPESSFALPQSSHDHSNKYLYDRTNPDPDSDSESPEVDRFTVQLVKDENGLGITIAGYVCEKEELSGIFVKSVTSGSAAALSGCIRVNDRIVAVDGVSLAGQTNQRAVDALKSSGHIVTLQLERYLRGPKYEQLQQAIAANEIRPNSIPATINPFLDMHRPDSGRSSSRSPAIPDIQMTHFEKGSEVLHYRQEEANVTPPDSLDTESVVETTNHALNNLIQPSRQPTAFDLPATPETEESIRQKWQSILGPLVEIVVGWVMRGSGGGLGISLEGTVDVEGGREVRPHHYVRSVLPEGPVGRAGVHRPGDELLEVNGHRLLGMNHLEVVSILKELPAHVCMVCARPRAPPSPPALPVSPPPIPPPLPALHDPPAGGALVKAKSDGSLAGALGAEEGSIGMGGTLGPSGTLGGGLGAPGGKLRSRSLEPLTGLAMWASEPQIIELVKGERGLGFSILDYQDPLRPAHTVVVIRSLVPGGVAQQDGRLIPGDRLLFVNEQNLENATLDQAVQALKGAPRGVVRIGVAKPLPLADNTPPPTTNTTTFNKMNTQ